LRLSNLFSLFLHIYPLPYYHSFLIFRVIFNLFQKMINIFLIFKNTALLPCSGWIQRECNVVLVWRECNINLMLHLFSFKESATSAWCCGCPHLKRVQHQLDVAVVLFQRKCNINLMLRLSSFEEGATSTWCCGCSLSKKVQHQLDVAVVLAWRGCNINLMLRLFSFKESATSTWCWGCSLWKKVQHQLDYFSMRRRQ